MHDAVELALLLVLMVLGHNAVRGARNPARETALGLAVWFATIAVLVVLILFPKALAAGVRILAAVAAVYIVYGLSTWLYHHLRPVPYLPEPRQGRIGQLLASAVLPAAVRRAVVAQSLQAAGGRAAIAAAGIVEDLLARPEGERLAAETREWVAEQKAAADATLEALRTACGNAHTQDQPLVDGVILRYGAKTPLRVLRGLRLPPAPAHLRRPWVAALQKERVSPARAALLHYLNIEVTAETRSQESAWSRLRGGRRLPAILSPTYAYLVLGEPRRALLFSLSYLLTVAYGVFSLAEGLGARALVFLAVAGLLHLSALVNLDVVCAGPVPGRCPPQPASPEARGAAAAAQSATPK